MRACPFCASELTTIVTVNVALAHVSYPTPEISGRAKCLDCGALGPEAQSDKDAARAWNDGPPKPMSGQEGGA